MYSVLAVERAPLACVLRSTSGLVGVTRLSLLSLDLGEELFHRSDERLPVIVNTPGDVGPLAVLGLDVLSSLRSFRSRLCNLGRLSFAPLLHHHTVAEAKTVSHQHPSTDAQDQKLLTPSWSSETRCTCSCPCLPCTWFQQAACPSLAQSQAQRVPAYDG
jgi:hypothetical protein